MKRDKIHNISTSGFKTPDHYFDTLEAQLYDRLDEKEFLNGENSTGFTVPKNYFDTVENNILRNRESEEKPVISLKPRTTTYSIIGIAASIIFLFGLFFNSDDQINIEAIDTATIENYLYQEDYTSEEFASFFNPNDISETAFIEINLSDDTINEYLESIDTEDFITD
ncbi:hypothetical protein [Winogradskyella bathintestinalis]|uniref:Uncharacterized protein n=1 Tax=Winogradskyella bathintestinalis TaxID=3035208 RepID=A0ABT7ZTI1_9FLAO|nr:hypothetical protein [Winogradskyella bathintestinalis]MDN3492310.1 hypothetical protein [Winogradskyella bathintestinalis]